MASLIPGYEYDIFISYRQKDNRHDGWVTEFVRNLRDDIAGYYDLAGRMAKRSAKKDYRQKSQDKSKTSTGK